MEEQEKSVETPLNSENQGVSTKLSFDEMLKDKDYQSEFDRRLAKALNTQKEKYENERLELIGNQTKQEDAFKELEGKFNEITSKYGELEKTNLIYEGITNKKDEVEFALFKLNKQDGEFKDNLKTYLENKPQEPNIQTTGFEQRNNVAINPDKEYLDKKYKNNPYYKG